MKLFKKQQYKLVYVKWVDPYLEDKELVLGSGTISDNPGVNHLVGFMVAENKVACCVAQTLLFKRAGGEINQHAVVTM